MSSVPVDPPVLVTRDAFHVVGIRERYQQGMQFGIPAQWGRFVPRIDEIANRNVHRTYGVCVCEAHDPTLRGPPHFQYTACAEVSAIERVPDGMVGFTVPGGTFAVFTHRGPIADFGATVQAVWGGGLAAAGLTPTGAPDFELYDERFCGGGEGSIVEIFIPVVPRG